jgi:hypothetical protein
VKTGLFSTTDASDTTVILPIFRLRFIKLDASISGGDEADQTVQETNGHRASGNAARFKNLTVCDAPDGAGNKKFARPILHLCDA